MLWRVLTAIAVVALAAALAVRVRALRQEAQLSTSAACTQDVMVRELVAYKKGVLWLTPFGGLVGLALAASLARRLSSELRHGKRGDGARVTTGAVTAAVISLAVAALLYLSSPRCTRVAVRSEALGGLPGDLAAQLYSQVGDFVPIWWLALGAETVVLTVLWFAAGALFLRLPGLLGAVRGR